MIREFDYVYYIFKISLFFPINQQNIKLIFEITDKGWRISNIKNNYVSQQVVLQEQYSFNIFFKEIRIYNSKNKKIKKWNFRKLYNFLKKLNIKYDKNILKEMKNIWTKFMDKKITETEVYYNVKLIFNQLINKTIDCFCEKGELRTLW